MTTLHHILPNEIDAKWHLVEPSFITVISEASEPEFSVADLKFRAMRGNVLIAYIEEEGEILMALAMEFIYYANFKVLHVPAMAGARMAELFGEHSDEIGEFAKTYGATHFQACGSPAMARIFKRLGYYTAYEVMRYKL